MKNFFIGVQKSLAEIWDGVSLSGDGKNIVGGRRLNFYEEFIRYDISSTTQSFNILNQYDYITMEEKSRTSNISLTTVADATEIGHFSQQCSNLKEFFTRYLFKGFRRTFVNIIGLPFLLGTLLFKSAAAGLGEIYSKTDKANIFVRVAAAIILKPVEIACRIAGNVFHNAKSAVDCVFVGSLCAPCYAAYQVTKKTGSILSGVKTFFKSFFCNVGLFALNLASPAAVIASAGVAAPVFPVLTSLIFNGLHAGATATSVATNVVKTISTGPLVHTSLPAPVVKAVSAATADIKRKVLKSAHLEVSYRAPGI